MSLAVKLGASIPVRSDTDGTPLCPWCIGFDERMVEVEPGQWMCPTGVEMQRQMTDAIVKAADAMAASFRKPITWAGVDG